MSNSMKFSYNLLTTCTRKSDRNHLMIEQGYSLLIDIMMPSTNMKHLPHPQTTHSPSKSRKRPRQPSTVDFLTQPDIRAASKAPALLCLLEFSELSGFLIPQGYCVDPVIPAQKYPGSDSPGVQVMRGSVFPHA